MKDERMGSKREDGGRENNRRALTKKNFRLVRRIIPYFSEVRGLLAFDIICACLTSFCELALPIIVGKLTDAASLGGGAGLTVKMIVTISIGYFVMRLIDAAAGYFMASKGHLMGTKVETRMRDALFAKMMTLPCSYYDNTKIGQLMSRITSDLFDITEFAHHMPEETFITAIKTAICLTIYIRMNVWLSLGVFAMLPVMILLTRRSRMKMRSTFKESRHRVGEINAATEDSLLGIRVVKSFAGEETEKEKFAEGSKKYLEIKKRNYRYMASFHTTVRLLDGVMYTVIVAVGALLLMCGRITPGGFTTSLLLVSTLLGSIRRIVDFSEQFNRGTTGIERFAEVMDEIPEEECGTEEVGEIRGEITLENVSFFYPGTDKLVIDNLSMTVPAGSNIALVAASGVGKTTICNLIPRFYETTGGRILLDGEDIRGYTLHSLRRCIGVVQQDVYMFSGTVRQNIAYGRPEATDDEIVAAAKLAGAHEFIAVLPEGYDSYIGERGVKLSGGQKQRLSIARVFLKNPPILILDEATSSLDNESEKLVQESLEKLSAGRTTVTVAHRLTTVRNADRIFVFDENGIAECGTHAELIEKGGLYSGLYSMYNV